MTLGFLIEIAIKSSLICIITLLALKLLESRSAAERSFVAHLGLAATPVVSIVAMTVPLPMMPAFAWADSVAWLNEAVAPIWVYLLPAAIFGVITLTAVFRLFGLRHRAAVLVEPAWLGALAHAQRRMGFKSGAALLVSPDITSPVSWGLFRPTIVLDERALQAEGEAEAIIAHELAHVARSDWAKLLLARIATALYWFNPLVWVLARQCHELREEAADDTVLRHEVDGSDYAAILVGHARHECRGLLLAANGVAPGKGSLRRRVTRVLDGTLRRAPAGLGFAAAVVLAATVIGTPLAALTLRAPAAPAAPASPAEPAAPAALGSLHGFKNGRPVASVAPVTSVASATSVSAVAPIAPLPPQFSETRVKAMSAQIDADAQLADAAQRLAHETLARADVKRAVADAQRAVQLYAPGELVAMSTQGVTPGWLNEMAALGYRNLTIGQIMSMAVQGVGPDYVRGMAAAGYPRLTPQQIVALRIQGVTPEYARTVVAAQGVKPSPEWLLAMRMGGYPHGMKMPPRALKAPRASAAVPAPPAPPRRVDDDLDN